MRHGRLVAGLAAVVIAPTVMVLPVITGPVAEIRPITPEVTQIALAGLDPVGLRSSASPAVVAEPAAVPVAANVTTTRPARAAAPKPAPRPLAPAVVTPETATAPFSLVGVDWDGAVAEGTVVQVRVRENGAWGAW